MNKVLVDRVELEEAAKWLEVHSSSSGSAEAFAAEALREAIAQPAEAEGVDRQRMIESMCLTWRHDFGLEKLEGCDFCSGMTDKEREHLRGQMGKLFDHHFAPALSAVTAERDRVRDEMGELWKQLDKFRSQSHGITALAEIERLRAEVDSLRKAFMKMRNVAAGYSNCCEFDSANTRRLEREFEAADELFLSVNALAAKEA
jgi:hypothetical protein